MSDDIKKDENNNLEEDQHQAASDFEFLQEKIKERPINKKKLLKKMIVTASLAVLFGLLACLSFVLLEPVLNNWLYPEEEPEIVTFPQEQNEMLPEDMLTEGTTTAQSEDAPGSTGEEMTTQDQSISEDIPASAVPPQDSASAEHPEEGRTDTEIIEPLKPYQTQYEELYKVYREVESSMVTVTAVRSDVDWFNNTYQSEGVTAGVIIANNNRELLILSRKSPLDEA